MLCRLVQEPPQLAAHDSVRVRTAFPQLGLQPPQPLYVYAGLTGVHAGGRVGGLVGGRVGRRDGWLVVGETVSSLYETHIDRHWQS